MAQLKIGELLNAVFFLAAKQGLEFCINPEEGKIYEVKNRSKADVTLLPLGEMDNPIFDFNPEKLVFRNNLTERSLNIAPESLENAFGTLTERTDIHSAKVEPTQKKREDCISETKNNVIEPQYVRDYIGVGKVDLPKFSKLYTGETAKVSAQVEDLLDKIFSATNYPKTIDKTVENYHTAKKLAKEGKIYELKQLAERLQGRINKQGAMQSAMNTMAAQTQAKRKMLISAAIAATAALLYFGIPHIIPKTTDTQVKTEFYSATLSTNSELDAAIAEWERTTGKKIYPKGRECLERATKGMTKKQIIKVINQNVK